MGFFFDTSRFGVLEFPTMDGYLQTGIGVAVSLVLFFVTYRQTIGARRERSRLANAELHRAVLRRMVLEGYQPSVADMDRLARGKARYHRIPSESMSSPSNALIDIYATVFDNDLIAAKDRDNLQQRIIDALDQMPDQTKERSSSQTAKTRSSRDVSLIAGVAASVVGALFTLLASLGQNGVIEEKTLVMTVTAFVGSLAITGAAMALWRLRDRTEATTGATHSPEVRLFAEVGRLLKKSGLQVDQFVGGDSPRNVDYLITTKNKRVAVETLDLSGRQLRTRIDENTLPVAKDIGANQLWIVTPAPVSESIRGHYQNEPVEFLNPGDLKSRLSTLKANGESPAAAA